MITASIKKQDLQASAIRIKLSELYEQLHFNEIYLQNYPSSRNATELKFSSAALGKKMKNLRLRPSPPTPGERNLRLHWQQNSAACSEILRSHRKAVSAPMVTRTQSRNAKIPTLKINLNNVSQDRAIKRPSTTHKTSFFKAFSKENHNAASKLCSIYPQRTNTLGRSHTFVDIIRPSLRSQTRIKIPQTPLNSPDAGIKVVRVTTKLPDPQPESKIVNDNSLDEIKQLDDQLSKNCDINPINLEHSSDTTMSSSRAKQNSSLSHEKVSKKQQSAMTINLSRQLLDMRKKADVTFGKVDWMKIKSFHKKNEFKSKKTLLRKSSDGMQKFKSSLDSMQPNSSVKLQNYYFHKQKSEAITTKNLLQIRLPENLQVKESPQCHDTACKYPSKINSVHVAFKKQFRRSKHTSHQVTSEPKKTEISGENLYKYCNMSLFNEKQLVVPNPSLVDFGKRSVHTGPESEPRTSNVYDSVQDPAVMLRILSWLEKVESNSEFYYGFDAEKL